MAERICVVPSERAESALHRLEKQAPRYAQDDSPCATSQRETQ